jgi:hypothetical protein
LEQIGVNGKIILKRTFKKWDGCIAWTDLAQYRDRWQAAVKVVMILRIP